MVLPQKRMDVHQIPLTPGAFFAFYMPAPDYARPVTLLRPAPPNALACISSEETVKIYLNGAGIERLIFTSAATSLAQGLAADWRNVRFEVMPPGVSLDELPCFSMQQLTPELSRRWYKIGLAMRLLLLEAASQSWGVLVSQCHALQGQVQYVGSERCISYGQLAPVVGALAVPEEKVVDRFAMETESRR